MSDFIPPEMCSEACDERQTTVEITAKRLDTQNGIQEWSGYVQVL